MTAYDLSWGRLPPCRPPRLPNLLVMPRQTRFGLARNLRSECKAAQTAPQRMHSGCLGPRLIPISLNPFAPVCPLVAYAWRPDCSAEDGAAAGSPHHPNGGCGRWLFAVRSRVGRGGIPPQSVVRQFEAASRSRAPLPRGPQVRHCAGCQEYFSAPWRAPELPRFWSTELTAAPGGWLLSM